MIFEKGKPETLPYLKLVGAFWYFESELVLQLFLPVEVQED